MRCHRTCVITIQTTTINLETKRSFWAEVILDQGEDRAELSVNRKLTKGVDVGKLMTRESQLLIDSLEKEKKVI